MGAVSGAGGSVDPATFEDPAKLDGLGPLEGEVASEQPVDSQAETQEGGNEGGEDSGGSESEGGDSQSSADPLDAVLDELAAAFEGDPEGLKKGVETLRKVIDVVIEPASTFLSEVSQAAQEPKLPPANLSQSVQAIQDDPMAVLETAMMTVAKEVRDLAHDMSKAKNTLRAKKFSLDIAAASLRKDAAILGACKSFAAASCSAASLGARLSAHNKINEIEKTRNPMANAKVVDNETIGKDPNDETNPKITVTDKRKATGSDVPEKNVTDSDVPKKNVDGEKNLDKNGDVSNNPQVTLKRQDRQKDLDHNGDVSNKPKESPQEEKQPADRRAEIDRLHRTQEIYGDAARVLQGALEGSFGIAEANAKAAAEITDAASKNLEQITNEVADAEKALEQMHQDILKSVEKLNEMRNQLTQQLFSGRG